MLRALVVGHATATEKHESMNSNKLLIVQPLGDRDSRDGFPFLIVDTVGAGLDDVVLLTSDGRYAREYMNSKQTPVRWTLIGIED